jgi:WD40 repeat protein
VHILESPMLSHGAQHGPVTDGHLDQVRQGARIRLQVFWRWLLAAPFGLSLVLTLVLGPDTIDSRYTSFLSLAGASLLVALLMLRMSGLVLLLIGLIVLLLFPPLVGVGFYFAPDWLQPAVWISFYGAILAASAAIALGFLSAFQRLARNRRAQLAIRSAGPGLLGVAALAVVAGSANAAVPPLGDAVAAVNLGSSINTAHREAEPTFTADGRTMYFNCNDYDICVSHLAGAWEDAQWSTPQFVAAPISTAYPDVEPLINAAGDRLYFTSMRSSGLRS